VTELEAHEVGASLKWATPKVERISQRGGDFNDARLSEPCAVSALGPAGGAELGSSSGDGGKYASLAGGRDPVDRDDRRRRDANTQR
jgi:hypothetical protein